MAMMKALILKAYGEPKAALEVRSIPKPTLDPASDQVLVRVIASSLNPIDWYIVKGYVKIMRDFLKTGRMGYDMSGVIEAVGAKVKDWKVGDEVITAMQSAAHMGTMAEYVCIPAAWCVRKPSTLTHVEASCLPIAGVTALGAMKRHQGARDVAVIPGGMGGVGSLGVQLAKNMFGFKKVITTVSTAKVPLIKKYIPNVDQVIDYKTTPIESAIPDKSVDFILDSTGKIKPWVRFLNTARPASQQPSLITVTAALPIPGMEHTWDTKFSWWFKLVLGFVNGRVARQVPKTIHFEGFIIPKEQSAEVLTQLSEEAEKGNLRPIVYKVFPFEQAVEAFEMGLSGKAHGKVVLQIADEP